MVDSYEDELQRVLSMTLSSAHSSPLSEPGTPRTRLEQQHTLGAAATTPRTPQRRIFDCPWEGCSRTFKKRDHMQSHLRQHTGETPYECPVAQCALKFKWRSSLRNHLRYHDPMGSSPIRSPPSVDSNHRQLPPSLAIGPSLAEAGAQTPSPTVKRANSKKRPLSDRREHSEPPARPDRPNSELGQQLRQGDSELEPMCPRKSLRRDGADKPETIFLGGKDEHKNGFGGLAPHMDSAFTDIEVMLELPELVNNGSTNPHVRYGH